MSTPQPQPQPPPPKPSAWQVAQSVAAAFFGVQSSRNRVRDFQHGKHWHYLLTAVLMTAALVLFFYGLVQLVLHYAAAP